MTSKQQSLQKLGFRVRWCSSEEATNPSSELVTQSPQSKGWQSSRFCTYPQEIVLQLLSPSRVRQIQFLSHQNKIAQRIEVLVCYPEGNSDLKFRKLGYLTLDSNERSAFQSRELKSVFIDANCLYIKVIFHKYHPNTQNLFNQVGLIAVSCFGEPTSALPERIETSKEGIESSLAQTQPPVQFDNITLDRLRTLEAQKDRAVQNEQFEEAKRIKEAIQRLKQVAMKLRQLEDRKQLAVKNEDYESAKIIKAEIERLRNGVTPEYVVNRPAQIYSPSPMMESQQNQMQEEMEQQMQQQQFQRSSSRQFQRQSPRQFQQDERHQDIQSPNQQQQQYQQQSIEEGDEWEGNVDGNTSQRQNEFGGDEDRPIRPAKEYQQQDNPDQYIAPGIPNHDEVVLPAVLNKDGKKPWEQDDAFQDGQDQQKQDQGPEKLSGDAKKAVDQLSPIIGEELAKKLFAKSWQTREDALKQLKQELENPKTIHVTDPHSVFQAITEVCANTLGDKVNQVSLSSISLLQQICTSKYKPTSVKGDLSSNIDSCIYTLVEVTASQKNKQATENAYVALGQVQAVGYTTIINALAKPTGNKQKILNAPKYLVARLQVMQLLLKRSTKDTPYAPIVEFASKQVLNPNAQVREQAIAAIAEASKLIGLPQIEPFIASLPEQQKELVMQEISGTEKKKAFSPAKETKKAANPNQKNEEKPKSSKKKVNKKQKDPNNEHVESNVCEFCNKFSAEFGDKNNMDIHLWRECPMLLACNRCAQVIEISSYSMHLLEECQDSKKFKQCSRCKEPILATDLVEHVKKQTCTPAKDQALANRCPLCHKDVEPGIEGWRKHLATEGCQNNERSKK